MATIIATSLQLQSQAEDAAEQLINTGFAPEKVTSFYVNPPGQHALYPIGGDHYQSPPETAGKATSFETVFTEVAEAVIGAMHDKNSPDDADKTRNEGTASHADSMPFHRAGMMVAVEVASQADQGKAVTLLTQLGAINIEKAEGEIVDGEWLDFDPFSEPCYL